ncbi:MAG: hypothetical protein LBE91_18810 [Tannerella sp.]|nr:hypothetical protein [Tannerella sp.]
MIQKTIFEEITNKITVHQQLADVVSEILEIGIDAAYRRIRGKTELTLSEAIRLCSRFNISLDSISGNEHYNLFFRYNPIDMLNLNNYRIYIRQFTETVSSLTKSAKGEIYYTADDVPLFHFLRHREMMFFKIFVWYNAVSGTKTTFEQFVEEIEGKESLVDDFNRLENSYFKTSSHEIWTNNTIMHILILLEYYYEMGVFAEMETVRQLFRQLHEMMENLMQWTETGKKEEKGDFKLYISATYPENNYILLKNGENTSVAIRLYTVKSILTSNPSFCEETERWIKNLMDKSLLISGTSARERLTFFQNQKDKINDLQKKLIGS